MISFETMPFSASSLNCYRSYQPSFISYHVDNYDADNLSQVRLGNCEKQRGFEGSKFCGVMKDPALKSDNTEKSCVSMEQIELLASLGPDIWLGGLKAADGCYHHTNGKTWICLCSKNGCNTDEWTREVRNRTINSP